jgi:hypothetical protein
MKACFFCGQAVPDGERVYRSSTCPACGKDLKICRNCRFYSPGAHWDCQETIQDPVNEKERANFCEFFQFREARGPGAAPAPNGKQKARDELRKLFGEGE